MSAESLRRMWQQQDELQRLIGAAPAVQQTVQRRRKMSKTVRSRIGESLRARWAERRKAAG